MLVKLDSVTWFQEGPGVRNYQYTDSGTKLINVTNLGKKFLELDKTSRFISNEEANSKYKHFLCDNGDLVIASSGINEESLIKKVSFVRSEDLPLCMNTSVIRFKVIDKNKLNINYLYYFFKSDSYRNQIMKLMTGIAQLNFGPSHLRKINLKLLDIKKQNECVNILDEIANLINLCENQLIFFDELIKSRFIEMFHEKEFPICSIRNVVDTTKISAKKIYKSDDEIKYIDISSIDNKTNSIVGHVTYKFKDAPSRAQQCLKTNDILVSTVRPNLRNVALFDEVGNGFVGSSGFCVLRPLKCDPQYLRYIVLSDKFTEEMTQLTNGANYPAIRENSVFDYLFISPPLHLQNEFADFVKQIDKSKFIVQKRIKTYKELLDKKMDEYFGKE
ncbi:MAG: restriction endonuclease subunit S [Malacoplasma sp.]|nr:restriction endonuclease subunit S [Malacoplasma sp.]